MSVGIISLTLREGKTHLHVSIVVQLLCKSCTANIYQVFKYCHCNFFFLLKKKEKRKSSEPGNLLKYNQQKAVLTLKKKYLLA
jgi:coproporphyrinogen III oxidase